MCLTPCSPERVDHVSRVLSSAVSCKKSVCNNWTLWRMAGKNRPISQSPAACLLFHRWRVYSQIPVNYIGEDKPWNFGWTAKNLGSPYL